MDGLEKLRYDIDEIDKELVKYFEKRMEAVVKVGEYKKGLNIPILDRSREEEVIRKNVNRLSNKDFEIPLKEFIVNLMDISKKVQKNIEKDGDVLE